MKNNVLNAVEIIIPMKECAYKIHVQVDNSQEQGNLNVLLVILYKNIAVLANLIFVCNAKKAMINVVGIVNLINKHVNTYVYIKSIGTIF